MQDYSEHHARRNPKHLPDTLMMGRLRLKVDDKNGLVPEDPYDEVKGQGHDGQWTDRPLSIPKLCVKGVPCKRVDSRVYPSTMKPKKRRRHLRYGFWLV